MVAAGIDDHVILLWHVAIHATYLGLFVMVMMGRLLVLLGIMALQADCGDIAPQFQSVGIMAIATAHALGEHFALPEGIVFIHFILDLPVYLILVGFEESSKVMLVKTLAGFKFIGQRGTAGMADGTGLQFMAFLKGKPG